jgi:hypothetical protein
MSLKIACPRSESVGHETRAAVAADDVDVWPFVDAVTELPLPSAVALPLPVDAAPSEDRAGVGAEGDATALGVKSNAQAPRRLDQKTEQVFSIVEAEFEPGTIDNSGAERFDVLDSEQAEGLHATARYLGYDAWKKISRET